MKFEVNLPLITYNLKQILGDISMADEKCSDSKCYKHGIIRVRGARTSGKVVSAKAKHTVIIEKNITKFLSKYKRWAKEHSRIAAHNPPCISAKVGDMVRIGETRKLSRTKAWTVLEVLGKADGEGQ